MAMVLLLCFVVILFSLGLPKVFKIKPAVPKEPIAIIEDLDSKEKIVVGINDTIGGNIQVLGVENGKIRLLVRQEDRIE